METIKTNQNKTTMKITQTLCTQGETFYTGLLKIRSAVSDTSTHALLATATLTGLAEGAVKDATASPALTCAPGCQRVEGGTDSACEGPQAGGLQGAARGRGGSSTAVGITPPFLLVLRRQRSSQTLQRGTLTPAGTASTLPGPFSVLQPSPLTEEAGFRRGDESRPRQLSTPVTGGSQSRAPPQEWLALRSGLKAESVPSAWTQGEWLVGPVFPPRELEDLWFETPNQSRPQGCQPSLPWHSPSLTWPFPCSICSKVTSPLQPGVLKWKAIICPPPRMPWNPTRPAQGTPLSPSALVELFLPGGGWGLYLLSFHPRTPASLSLLSAAAHKGVHPPPWLRSPESRVSWPRPERESTYFSGGGLTPRQAMSNKFEIISSFFFREEERRGRESKSVKCHRDYNGSPGHTSGPQISMASD